MRRRNLFIFALVFVVLLLLFVWFANRGYIEVSTPGQTKTAYTLFDQTGNPVSKADFTSSFKKLVKRGTYQLLVETGGKSEYRILKTKGFFGITKVVPDLRAEKSRQFVGNNPNFCMQYEGGVLFSYNCEAQGGLTVHLPATTKTPTTVISEKEPPYIPLSDLVSVGGKTKSLIVDDEQGEAALYDIDNQLRQTNPIPLLVEGREASRAQAYKTGFITYSERLDVVHYFSTPLASPSQIKTYKPQEKISHAVALSTSQDQVGALFNSASEEGQDPGLREELDNQVGEDESGSSEFVMFGNQEVHFSFGKLYVLGGLCGHNKLCLKSRAVMDVYDIGNKKAKYLFSVRNAQKAFSAGENIVIVTDKKILSVNQNNLVGSVQYSFGENSFCGINQTESGYVVCAVHRQGNKFALAINLSLDDSDSIDKKVTSLLEDPNIDTVSPYKNFIYVSPDLGQPVFNPATKGYEFDPAIKRATSQKIKELVRRLGIDTSKYKVINPYDN